MDIVNRFMSFDKLIGTVIVKIMYWLGLIAIALGVLFAIFGSFSQFSYNATGAIGQIVLAPIGGVIAIVFWRLMCELYISIFKIANDLHDIKTGGGMKPPV